MARTRGSHSRGGISHTEDVRVRPTASARSRRVRQAIDEEHVDAGGDMHDVEESFPGGPTDVSVLRSYR